MGRGAGASSRKGSVPSRGETNRLIGVMDELAQPLSEKKRRRLIVELYLESQTALNDSTEPDWKGVVTLLPDAPAPRALGKGRQDARA